MSVTCDVQCPPDPPTVGASERCASHSQLCVSFAATRSSAAALTASGVTRSSLA